MSALEQRTRRDHIIFVMGRGKQWTVPETKALLEAFIHISEDAVVGTDQSSERLYQRVSDEAKTRYQGDWMRTGDGCKKRWAQVSKEVLRFCSSMKVTESVERSGWSDEDYLKAAKEYYCQRYKQDFKFEAEWNYLKDFEKWKTSATSDSKRSVPQEDSDDTMEAEEPTEETPQKRPLGNKKQKTMQILEAKADKWMEAMVKKKDEDDERSGVLLRLMEGNIEESRNNRESLKKVLEEQTERLTSALDKSTAALNKSTALKALVRLDLTEFDDDFQKKAKKKLEEELGSLLGF